MSIPSKSVLAAFVALTLGTAALSGGALAQTTPPSSVLPTGGGKALIDTSDTVILLLDHQSGLFQTVNDISVPRRSILQFRSSRRPG